MKLNYIAIAPLVALFLCAIIYFLPSAFLLNIPLLVIGNLLLCGICMLSYKMLCNKETMQGAGGRKFVNKMLASTMLRLATCIVGIVSVMMYYKSTLPKVNVLLLFLFYLVHSTLESYFVIKLNKEKIASN